MRRKLNLAVVIAGVLLATAIYAGRVVATPQTPGFAGTTIAKGYIAGDIEVSNHVLREVGDPTPRKDLWLSLQKTKGPSDLYVQNNTWTPGAHTGWHRHPGHSLIIVTEGEVTNYDADDPACTPTRYSQGMAFVDHGGDHSHLLRNEGAVTARTVAVQLLPAGATRRIDAEGPPPGACPF